MFIIGILLAVISIAGINSAWRANEWREPLLHVSAILKREQNEQLAHFYSQARKRGTFLSLFLLLLYLIGAILISTRHTAVWLIILELIIFLWLTKAVVGLLRAAYSPSVRLLNYLYSPYLLAWRRDHWSLYNDEQIANAICRASGIAPQTLFVHGMTLDDFLLALCNHARPENEAQLYPDVLKQLHTETDGMPRMS